MYRIVKGKGKTNHLAGEANRLLAMLCQPADLLEMIAIPDDIVFWGVDSGIRHSVAGADYGSVRAAAFMGYRIIAELAGLTGSEAASGGTFEINDQRWGGYLANVSPAELENRYLNRLPERLSGSDFLSRYKSTVYFHRLVARQRCVWSSDFAA